MDSARFDRAIALRDAGKDEDALMEFDALAAITLNTEEKSSLLANGATCLARLGRFNEARRHLSEAERCWTNPYTEFADACLCVFEGKRDEAARKLALFLQKYSGVKELVGEEIYADAQKRLGLLLFELDRFTQAVHPLQEALRSAEGDQHRSLCFYLGVCHLRNGHLDVAEEKLIQSLPTDYSDPLWSQAQYNLGNLYFQRGAYLNAKKAFELCEAFVGDADVQMKESVSIWLDATHRRLREHSESRTQ